TDISTTSQSVKVLEDWIMKDSQVKSVGTFVGTGGPRWYLALSPEQNYSNFAFLIVNLNDPDEVDATIAKIKTHINENFPVARPRVYKLEMGPPVGYPIQVRLTGRDMDVLYALRDKIEAEMESVPGMSSIHDNWGEWSKKL